MVRPPDATLPAEFLQADWNNFKQTWRLPSCLVMASRSCEGFLVDLTGDGAPEIVLFDGMKALVFAKNADGNWGPGRRDRQSPLQGRNRGASRRRLRDGSFGLQGYQSERLALAHHAILRTLVSQAPKAGPVSSIRPLPAHPADRPPRASQ